MQGIEFFIEMKIQILFKLHVIKVHQL
jgi:hypothetical protein